MAQEHIACLIRDGRAPTVDVGQLLADAFNLADAWITMQNTATLMKEVDYVERELGKKTGGGTGCRRATDKIIEGFLP